MINSKDQLDIMYKHAINWLSEGQLVLVHPKLGGLSVKIYIERDLYQPNIVIG